MSRGTVTLREANLADLGPLVEVQQDGAVEALGNIFPQATYPFPADRVRARWASEVADPAVRAYVVEDDLERIVGFAATRECELLHFGTARHTWGTGVAVEAHDLLLDRLRVQGVTHAWLRVFEENHRARRFYERLGWSPTDRRSRTSFPPRPVLVEYTRSLLATMPGEPQTGTTRSDRRPFTNGGPGP